MITKTSIKLVAAAAALSLVATGCQLALVRCVDTSEYVLAEHQGAALVSSNKDPEISAAQLYNGVLPSVRKIGLQFPDYACKTQTAAKTQGEIRNQGESDAIMATTCGVWLAELERALTEHGFEVVSWGAIQQQQANRHQTTYEAARELGAQVVFVVNSMETNDLTPDSTTGSRTTYFRSDEAGSKKEALAMPQSEREPLRRFVVQHNAANANQVIGWAGTLDLTAVHAESGQSIWFFRHHIQRARFAQTGMRFLFRREGKNSPFEIWRPQGVDEPVMVDDRSASDVEFQQVKAGPADPFQAEKHAMVRAVTRACVTRFASGK